MPKMQVTTQHPLKLLQIRRNQRRGKELIQMALPWFQIKQAVALSTFANLSCRRKLRNLKISLTESRRLLQHKIQIYPIFTTKYDHFIGIINFQNFNNCIIQLIDYKLLYEFKL